jgi:hypothetical protein
MNQTGTCGTGSPRAAFRNAEEATPAAIGRGDDTGDDTGSDTGSDTGAIVAGQAARRYIGTANRA